MIFAVGGVLAAIIVAGHTRTFSAVAARRFMPPWLLRNDPLDAKVARTCLRVSHSLSGNAGLRGTRFFSKRERTLGPWCGSDT
jgi:hypothetical protein